jgi:hypothetical protein
LPQYAFSVTLISMTPRSAWEQFDIPAIYKQKRGPLLVRLPYRVDNGEWLQGDCQHRHEWKPRLYRWETPRSWFDRLVSQCLNSYGQVYVIQEFRPQQKCAPACWDAEGVDCVCSCGGRNHGEGQPSGRWFILSDTCAVASGKRNFSCRLLKKNY